MFIRVSRRRRRRRRRRRGRSNQHALFYLDAA
jgi:hypothetical protein